MKYVLLIVIVIAVSEQQIHTFVILNLKGMTSIPVQLWSATAI